MKLLSLGAAKTVTGSKHILETSKGRLLIDCGLFQGLGAKNPDEVPEELSKIDAIILTHGHLDHCGYIPKLVKHGFNGQIFSTLPTREIAKLIMADNAKIQSHEARKKNKKEVKESKKVKALYDLNDVATTAKLFHLVELNESFLWNGLEIEFKTAGHILGASSVRIKDQGTSIVFSGDLGRFEDPIMPNPESFNAADSIVMECTYGNKLHDKDLSPLSELEEVLKKYKEGTILIPAFSVARSQNIMYYLNKLFHSKPKLKRPVYIDSALTLEVTKLYEQFDDSHKISSKEFAEIHRNFSFIEFKSQRETLESNDEPKIILTASGMLSGGLAPHYLKLLSSNPHNALMIVGFQALGTLGRSIVDGSREIASEDESFTWKGDVYIAKSFSSHADQSDLLHWLAKIQGHKRVYLVHGEEIALDTMAKILGEKACIVEENTSYTI